MAWGKLTDRPSVKMIRRAGKVKIVTTVATRVQQATERQERSDFL